MNTDEATELFTQLLEMQPVNAKLLKEQIKALAMSEQSIWYIKINT